MKAFGWCFIGCGGLGHTVAGQITATGRHRVASVYARRYEKTEAFAAQYGAVPARSAAEAIAAPGVEGVYVVTPHQSHYEYARLALELGKPVLCEKSFTVNARQARELTALAEARGLYIAEAMWTWFAPVANQVKDWLDRGLFGRIERAEAAFRIYGEKSASRLFDPDRAGGALLDVGVYPLAYLYRLFGMPEAIRCHGAVEAGIDWEEDIELVYPGGLTALASASIRDRAGRESLTLAGTDARTDIPWFYRADRAELVGADGTRRTVLGDGSYLPEFDAAAADMCRGARESALWPHRATEDVMAIMDECRRQMGLVYPFER